MRAIKSSKRQLNISISLYHKYIDHNTTIVYKRNASIFHKSEKQIAKSPSQLIGG